MMELRHLDYPPDSPPEALGLAALDAILERGELADWEPLARAVKKDPFGAVAERILRVCAAHPMYGTSALWTTWVEGGRRRADATLTLAGLRQRRGLTQEEVARRLRSTQSDVSKLERRSDLRTSTLRAYAAALGGVVEIRVRFGLDPGHLVDVPRRPDSGERHRS